MKFTRLVAGLYFVCTLCTSALGQIPLDDTSMRLEVASRIARDHNIRVNWQCMSLLDLMDMEARLNAVRRINKEFGIAFDWQRTSLMDLMDAEARLNTARRINREFGIAFDWRKTSLMDLMDAEARMCAARRISKLTQKPVDWSHFTLMQLMEIEARASGVNVDSIKRQVDAYAVPQRRNEFPVVGRGLSVYVIAPSISTSLEARSIRMRNGWLESQLRQADAILVVVRSMFFNPLDYSYDSVQELEEDAETQLNISGDNFHVYIYSIDDDMRVNQVKHISYEAND